VLTTWARIQSFDEVFSLAHPVFQWIYRTTRNWRAVADLTHGMRRHIGGTDARSMTGSDASNSRHNDPPREDVRARASHDYSIAFRELFCIAAEDLAGQINEPLEKLGVLYDDILCTGRSSKKRTEHTVNSRPGSSSGFGHGQLLFVFRVVDKIKSARFQSLGYRFADVQQVIDILAKNMRVDREELITQLERMRDRSTGENTLQPGVHLTCFAIRADVKGGFDVLVRKEAKNLLPTMQLPIAAMDQTHIDLVKKLDGTPVESVMKFLQDKTTTSNPKEQAFLTMFYETLTALADEIMDPLFLEAVLVGKPLNAPGQATLIAFTMIEPIQSRAQNPQLQFSPLEFFRCQQHVYKDAPGHGIFARKIHHEFSSLGRTKPSTDDMDKHSLTIKPWVGWRRSPCPNLFSSENHSQKSLVETLDFGGIMVSREVNVSVDVRDRKTGDVELALGELGTRGEAMKEEGDVETFVDQLITNVSRFRSNPKP